MKIYEVLGADHKEASELIAKLEKKFVTQNPDAPALFKKLKTALTEHFDGEERLFYSQISQGGYEQAIQQAISQHDAVRGTLAKLESVVHDAEQAQPLVQELKARVSAHVEFEEGEVWSDGKNILNEKDAERIGNEMLEAEPDVHPVRSKIARAKEEMHF
jgi:iron-sulfur cluster repair protein YtfE (RIC family)